MTLISHKEAAAILGVHYETYRLHRAKGIYRGLQIKTKKGTRPKVVKESLLEIIRQQITEE